MKHRWTILVMAVVISLGSCSKENAGEAPPPANKKDCLFFGVEGVETRGVATTTVTIREFGVFCFDTKYSWWQAVAHTAMPNKMFNQLVVRGADDRWSYTPLVYWETYENKLHSFFAYSPLARGMQHEIDGTLNTGGNNLKLTTTSTTAGVPQLQFEAIDEISDQIDLLVAKEHLDLAPTDVVQMTFYHVLTRIGFKAFSEVAGTYIEEIEITDIPYKGSLPMTWPVSWTVTGDVKTFTLDYGNGVPVLAPESKPIDISSPGRYLMTIPQKWTSNTTAKVKVRFRQNGTTFNKEFLIGATGESWTENRSITYVLNLDGDPNADLLVDRVIIVDWVLNSADDSELGLQGMKYQLSFDSNGGDNNLPASRELETGTLYKIPDTIPQKADATFAGWATVSNGSGTIYQVGDRVPIVDANVTLYACWQ